MAPRRRALRDGDGPRVTPTLSFAEKRLLVLLHWFYEEHGPGAAPAIRELDEESGLERHEVEEAVRSLVGKSLVEVWELQPAVRLTISGVALAETLRFDGD